MVGITTATIIILLSGGGDVEHYLTDLKKDVKKHVDDKTRRKAILDESKALSKELKTLGKQVDDSIEDIARVHVEFGSEEADFQALTSQLVAQQKEASRLILDARDTMHEQMTREVWEAVFKAAEE
jgi:hypothetical protein